MGQSYYGPQQGLLGWWKLDETSGTSTADATGNGNTGTLTPNATGVWVAGQVNNAANLNGTTQYVDIANPGNFNFERTNAFTLSAWINRSSTTTEDEIIAKTGAAAPNVSYTFFMDPNRASSLCASGDPSDVCTSDCLVADLQGTVTNSRICVVASTTTATTGYWHHVVMTYDGSQLAAGVHVYVDGVSQSLYPSEDFMNGQSILNSTDLKIGVDVPGVGDEFAGKIDDVRVYNRALSAREVKNLYYATGGQ